MVQITTKNFQTKKHPNATDALDELFNSGKCQVALRAEGSLFSNEISNYAAMSFNDSFYHSHNSGAMIATGSSFKKAIGAVIGRATDYALTDSLGAFVDYAQDDALLRARDATVTGTLSDSAGTNATFNYVGRITGKNRPLRAKFVGSHNLRGRINGLSTCMGSIFATNISDIINAYRNNE